MKPDFSEIIFSIQRDTGLHCAQIAKRIGIPPSTLSSWKNGVVDPTFSKGVKLLDLYVNECGGEIPML